MTDYSKHTDAEIDRLVAERVMQDGREDEFFVPSINASAAFIATDAMGVWRFAVIQSPCSGWYAIASYAGVNARDVETVPVQSPARALCEAMLMARDIEEQEAT